MVTAVDISKDALGVARENNIINTGIIVQNMRITCYFIL